MHNLLLEKNRGGRRGLHASLGYNHQLGELCKSVRTSRWRAGLSPPAAGQQMSTEWVLATGAPPSQHTHTHTGTPIYSHPIEPRIKTRRDDRAQTHTLSLRDTISYFTLI